MDWTRLPFNTPGPDGCYRWRDTLLYVHLLGTNHPHEWHSHQTRNTGRIQTPIGRVHRDYYYAALKVVQWLDSQGYGQLIISGHSYGGAVAEIVAALKDGETVMVRTFGGVKAGVLSAPCDKAFHYRHRGDPVPWYPLWPWYRRKRPICIGQWKWPWVAHRIESYRDALPDIGIP
jgi:pimeloyl-ACP methyl ester carboxylesterase